MTHNILILVEENLLELISNENFFQMSFIDVEGNKATVPELIPIDQLKPILKLGISKEMLKDRDVYNLRQHFKLNSTLQVINQMEPIN